MPEEYNATVMEHFLNPRNIGDLAGANAVGVVKNPACGDMVKLSLKIEGDVVRDVRMKTFGCAAAIASTSMFTTMIKGKPLAEARKLKDLEVVRALGGLPEHKIRCSVLAEDALKEALAQYEKGHAHAQS